MVAYGGIYEAQEEEKSSIPSCPHECAFPLYSKDQHETCLSGDCPGKYRLSPNPMHLSQTWADLLSRRGCLVKKRRLHPLVGTQIMNPTLAGWRWASLPPGAFTRGHVPTASWSCPLWIDAPAHPSFMTHFFMRFPQWKWCCLFWRGCTSAAPDPGGSSVVGKDVVCWDNQSAGCDALEASFSFRGDLLSWAGGVVTHLHTELWWLNVYLLEGPIWWLRVCP